MSLFDRFLNNRDVNAFANQARDYFEPPRAKEDREKVSSCLRLIKTVSTIVLVACSIFALLAIIKLSFLFCLLTAIPLAFTAILASDAYKASGRMTQINDNVIAQCRFDSVSNAERHRLIFGDTLLLKHIFKF